MAGAGTVDLFHPCCVNSRGDPWFDLGGGGGEAIVRETSQFSQYSILDVTTHFIDDQTVNSLKACTAINRECNNGRRVF